MLIANWIKKRLLLSKNKGRNLMEKIKKMLILLAEIYFIWELEQLLLGCREFESK
jgi:hypothetical protein